jgi:hypothetical protein
MLRNIQMKLLVVALFCVSVPLSSLAQTNVGQQTGKRKTKVETNYDEKKNETIARIGPFELYRPLQSTVSGELNFESVDMTVLFSYSGKKIVKPKFVTLMVFSSSENGPEFDKKRDLTILTNSGQYNLGEMEIIGTGEGRVARIALGPANLILVREVLKRSIPFEDFAHIAQSEKVQMKIGNRKFKLGKEQLEAFKNFASLMEQEGLEF